MRLVGVVKTGEAEWDRLHYITGVLQGCLNRNGIWNIPMIMAKVYNSKFWPS